MLIISRAEVEALLDLDRLIDALGPAMRDLSEGRASVPPRVAALVPERDGFLAGMLGYVPSLGALAAKLGSLFPENAAGRPRLLPSWGKEQSRPALLLIVPCERKRRSRRRARSEAEAAVSRPRAQTARSRKPFGGFGSREASNPSLSVDPPRSLAHAGGSRRSRGGRRRSRGLRQAYGLGGAGAPLLAQACLIAVPPRRSS
jgi:hypothetical protein